MEGFASDARPARTRYDVNTASASAVHGLSLWSIAIDRAIHRRRGVPPSLGVAMAPAGARPSASAPVVLFPLVPNHAYYDAVADNLEQNDVACVTERGDHFPRTTISKFCPPA